MRLGSEERAGEGVVSEIEAVECRSTMQIHSLTSLVPFRFVASHFLRVADEAEIFQCPICLCVPYLFALLTQKQITRIH